MATSILPTHSGGQSFVSVIRKEYRKGYQIPVLPYQKNGILSRTLWPSKPSVIRIIPGYDPDTGEVFRQNKNVNTYSSDVEPMEYLSDTFQWCRTVPLFGTIKTSFISDYEPGSEDANKYAGDTVIRRFIRNIINAVDPKGKRKALAPHPSWAAWTGFGQGQKLKFDSVSLLMQSLVFVVNGRPNTDPETEMELRDAEGILPLLAVVILDKGSCIDKLAHALVDPSDRGRPLDAATNNTYGPMAELDGNKLYLNPNKVTIQGKETWQLDPSVQAAGQQGWVKDPFPLSEQVAKSLFVPWKDLLNYMTAQEQLELCAQEFGADTVNYVLGTDSQLSGMEFPDHIAKAGFGRYENLVGGSVTLTGKLKEQTPAEAGAGIMSRGLGMTMAPTPPSFTMPSVPGASLPSPTPAPAAPVQRPLPSLKGVNMAASSINTEELLKQVQQMRAKAAGLSEDTQAEDASSLLDDSPILGGN